MIFFKELWEIINHQFEGNPFMLFLALVGVFIIGKGLNAIPVLIRWRKGEIKKDKEERTETVEKLNKICVSSEKQEKHLSEINGTLSAHLSNHSIHTPESKLVTEKLFNERTGNIQYSIEAIFNRLNKQ